MFNRPNFTPVGAAPKAFGVATSSTVAGGTPATTVARDRRAFTLAELLVSVGVLAVLVLLFTQLLNSAATITTPRPQTNGCRLTSTTAP